MIKVLESVRNKDFNLLREQFALDVLTGFTAPQKYIASKYFYDSQGSQLFKAITDLEEYYPTRSEAEIFETHKSQLAEALRGEHFSLIELGAGDGRKTRILVEEFQKQKLDFDYVPVDISEDAVKGLEKDFSLRFKNLKFHGIVGEYFDSLKYAKEKIPGKKVVLFLGSNLGNFNLPSAEVFLRIMWKHLRNQDMALIGFDLKKDIRVMTRAYNDSSGVTAAFNLNLLERMNRELGACFDLSKFMHHGIFNPRIGAMESYLISTEEQTIYIKELEKSFHFNAFEPIHLEYSFKYLPSDVEKLSSKTGFNLITSFFDSRRFFMDSLWSVKKEGSSC